MVIHTIQHDLMVAIKAAIVSNFLVNLWAKIHLYQHQFDDFVMQDLSIESRCVLSRAFMTLCGVCMAIVLLVARAFALDKIDIEYAT